MTTQSTQALIVLRAVCLAFITSGCCSLFPSACGPKPPITLTSGKTLQYDYEHPQLTNFFRNAYQRAATNIITQTIIRNEIIDDLMALIDQNYADYEVALRIDRNKLDLGGTLIAMGLSAASTVSGGKETKTILSAIATGVLGAEAAVDKTIYKDLAIEAILAEMQRLRAERETMINTQKTNTTASYTLNRAIDDLVAYYNAGFVTRALSSLALHAGQAAEAARSNADAVRMAAPKNTPK